MNSHQLCETMPKFIARNISRTHHSVGVIVVRLKFEFIQNVILRGCGLRLKPWMDVCVCVCNHMCVCGMIPSSAPNDCVIRTRKSIIYIRGSLYKRRPLCCLVYFDGWIWRRLHLIYTYSEYNQHTYTLCWICVFRMRICITCSMRHDGRSRRLKLLRKWLRMQAKCSVYA